MFSLSYLLIRFLFFRNIFATKFLHQSILQYIFLPQMINPKFLFLNMQNCHPSHHINHIITQIINLALNQTNKMETIQREHHKNYFYIEGINHL